jgi:tripartite-type tricarboxylate transporter receptor subunit TctC
MPDVPTIIEAGVNVPPFNFWTGLLVKSGTPSSITQRLSKEVAAASLAPSVQAILTAAGSVPALSNDREELRKRISAEAASMGELAKQLNLKPE